MKITETELALLRGHRQRRDHAAFQIGVATAEWRRHVVKAEAIIAESEDAERADGEQILRAHGCDPTTGDYVMDKQTGEILRLEHGQYVAVN